MVELEGEPTEDTPGGASMLIDFKHVKSMVEPLVDQMDHATLVADYDEELKKAVEVLGSKTYPMEVDTTAENLARHFADHIGREGYDVLRKHGVDTIRVKLWETETCYAEVEKAVSEYGEDHASREAHAVDEEATATPNPVSA
jgi:6-pyruvoyltetrahydropterin/6-carboxytetrahydropterin synthase